MAVRTACVIAAIVVPGWPRWAFLAGAVLLPMLAVVVANAGQSRDEPGPQDLLMPPRALGAAGGPATPSAAMPGTR